MKIGTTAAPATDQYTLVHCRAVDGDTIEAEVHLGFDVFTKARFRLKGFYAPELDGNMPEQGRAARDVLQAALEGKAIAVKKRGMKKDHCGRWLSTLLIDGIAADPFLIIFPYQLSDQQHAADLRAAKANRSRNGGAL